MGSKYYTGSIVTEGVKHDLYLYADLGLKNQKFTIDKDTGVVSNEFTRRQVDVGAKGSKAADDNNIDKAWDLIMQRDYLGGRTWAVKECGTEVKITNPALSVEATTPAEATSPADAAPKTAKV